MRGSFEGTVFPMERKSGHANNWFDLDGQVSGIPLTRQKRFWIAVSVLLPFLTNLIPFPDAPKAGLAIGIILSDLILMLSGTIGCGISGALVCAMGILTELLEPGSVTGGSIFFQFTGLCMIGYGVEVTPLGRRFSYAILELFGKSPKRIVLSFLVVSAILSSFLSNTATVILTAALCHQILQQMGQRPGESRFAAACMLACAIGPNIGCGGFIQGSVGINIFSVEQIASVTKRGFTITPAQWASVGWLQLVILLPIVGLLLLKTVPFDSQTVSLLPPEHYRQQRQEMGPISGAEIRWLVLLISLIFLMLQGVNTTKLMLIYIVLLLFPGIGIMDAKTAFTKAVPWEIVFCGVTLSFIGGIFSASGLNSVLAGVLTPVLEGMHPLAIMLLLSSTAAVLAMYTVGTAYANIALTITMMAPVVESLGLNPAVILFPVILSVNYMMGYFATPMIAPNYQYGYWKQGEITMVGSVTALCAVIVNCLVTYFFAPSLWGVYIYLGSASGP